MSKKLSNVKERVLFIAENKGIAKNKFIESIGMTYGNFNGSQRKRPLNSDAINNILSNNPEISAEWLLTGEGSMIKEENVRNVKAKSNITGIPLLPISAFAGIGDTAANGVNFDTIEERYEVPLFDGIKIDFMLPVRGSSMYPKYSSGDVVACRLVKELLFIQWNKVYVIDTLSQGVIMKRLKKSTAKENLICKSDNADYDPFYLPKEEIRNIALVVGVIRLE